MSVIVAVSWRFLLEDLETAYRGEPLPPAEGWALPTDAFAHREGMASSPELRALAGPVVLEQVHRHLGGQHGARVDRGRSQRLRRS